MEIMPSNRRKIDTIAGCMVEAIAGMPTTRPRLGLRRPVA